MNRYQVHAGCRPIYISKCHWDGAQFSPEACLAMNKRHKRVLLVDDDESILESTQMALLDRGYDVFLARDGSEALVRVELDAPDLIVLDIVMPKRSGLAVLEKLRSRHGRSPRIIVVTGNVDPRNQESAEARGADAFVRKPFDIDDLLTQIESLIG